MHTSIIAELKGAATKILVKSSQLDLVRPENKHIPSYNWQNEVKLWI
jgi:ribosomal protein L25 (general stress protein Ctc)